MTEQQQSQSGGKISLPGVNTLNNAAKLSIKFGEISIVYKGKINNRYNEQEVSDYMKNSNIDITIDVASGKKYFTAYTMDLTKKYIEINANYRSWYTLKFN